MKRFLHTALVAAALVFPALLAAQPSGDVQSLEDSLRTYDLELSQLQNALEIATVDEARLSHTGIRAWIVGNPALRDSLFFALMAVDSSVQSEAGADARILATPEGDLIEVRFGNAVFKGLTLQSALDKARDKNLYAEVARSYRFSRDVELRDPDYALTTEYRPQLMTYDGMLDHYRPLSLLNYPDSTTFRSDLSLSGLEVRVGPLWGGEFKIGNEEIGFPFWTSGQMAFMATYKGIKLGFELPFKGGLNASDGFPPFIVRSRKLNGTRGVVGEFDFGPVGGKFSFTRLTDSDLDALTDPSQFYYITVIAQVYLSFGLELTPTNLVRVKAGVGTHRVNEGSIAMGPSDEQVFVPGPHTDFFSPYLKFEYQNNDIAEQFNVSVQYYDVTLITTAELQVIDNLLSIELLYMWPLSAELPAWQNPELFVLTPHLFISF